MRPASLWWLVSMAGAGLAVALALWDPARPGLDLCMFRRVLELPCPGCGLTRAAAYLVRGELGLAARLHPLAPLLALEAVILWALWGASSHRWIRLGPPDAKRIEVWGLAHAGLFLALWLGRLAIGDLAL